MNDVTLGLQVTGIGMGLVFLTLIIVMLAIWLLSWAFRPKAEQPAPAAKRAADAPPAGDDAAMAAAIATAIAAASAAKATAATVARPRTQAAAPWTRQPSIAYDDEADEIVGEVVHIAQIDADNGAWQSQARLNALQ
ncbi:MAG: OadG family protein [Anaerolineae bacterium]